MVQQTASVASADGGSRHSDTWGTSGPGVPTPRSTDGGCGPTACGYWSLSFSVLRAAPPRHGSTAHSRHDRTARPQRPRRGARNAVDEGREGRRTRHVTHSASGCNRYLQIVIAEGAWQFLRHRTHANTKGFLHVPIKFSTNRASEIQQWNSRQQHSYNRFTSRYNTSDLCTTFEDLIIPIVNYLVF